MIKTATETRELIEEAISKNKSIGFLDKGLFYIEVYSNPNIYYPMKIMASVMALFLFFGSLFSKDIPREYFWIYLLLISIPFLLVLLLCCLSLLCSHYLVLDINNNKITTQTKLFNKYTVDIFTSDPIYSNNIEKIILSTFCDNRVLVDKILVELDNGEEFGLTSSIALMHHENLKEKCLLLSECLNVDCVVRGEQKETNEKRRKK